MYLQRNFYIVLGSTSYPSKAQLETIYTEYLKGLLKEQYKSHTVWGNERNLKQLAKSTVQIYDFVSQMLYICIYFMVWCKLSRTSIFFNITQSTLVILNSHGTNEKV